MIYNSQNTQDVEFVVKHVTIITCFNVASPNIMIAVRLWFDSCLITALQSADISVPAAGM